MKAVLISIQPKWCEEIASLKKKVEIRKSKPTGATPFKCYIYCTQGKFADLGVIGENIYRKRMKVIGEFVCNKIVKFENSLFDEALPETVARSCVPMYDLLVYIGKQDYGYGWHISNLVIYDKPRELSEFKTPEWFRDCEKGCDDMERMRCPTKDSRKVDKMCDWCRKGGEPITRPPQSWCYVEGE